MNPRQRRGVLFLVLAAVGAIAVFVAVSSYVASVRKQVKPKTTELQLTRPVAAQTPITPDMVKAVSVPEKWAPPKALHDPAAIGNRVSTVPLGAGVVLQDDMLQPPPQLQPGEVELSIMIDADTGVAGKVAPGSLVDVEATFPGDQRSSARATIIVPHARVISVGTPQTGIAKQFTNQQSNNNGGGQIRPQVPVTFAVTPKQSLRVSYAESYATEVRLALVRQGETGQVSTKDREFDLPPSKQPAATASSGP
jgi:pilus assembly protein CpaB